MIDYQNEPEDLPYLTGRAWTFGDGVTAGQILPRGAIAPTAAPDRLLMGAVDPDFARRFTPGDFVVAGVDFGGGLGVREAARALCRGRVGAVIARLFAEGFFAAALGVGLPALLVEETLAIKTGDRLRVDIEGHKVVNLSSGDRYVIRNLHGEELEILRGRASGRAAPPRE